MTAKDLYLSFKSNARNLKTCVTNQVWSKDSENDTKAIITKTEFTITNKQGFFMQSLINKNPLLKHDKSVICYDGNDIVNLIQPPHYIKTNGFFKIVITNIRTEKI